jgi:hypothetical protein
MITLDFEEELYLTVRELLALVGTPLRDRGTRCQSTHELAGGEVLGGPSPASISASNRTHLPPRLRMHRQEIDDVGPAVASLVAVAEQPRGDRVGVGLVVDQDAAEVVSG